jgi:hypothetical protein
MLGAHVEDHPLVFVGLVVEDIVILDHPAQLLVEPAIGFVDPDLLGPFVRRGEVRGLLGAGDPDVESLGVLGQMCSGQ